MSTIKILVPRLYHLGGIESYYKTLWDYLNHEYEYIYRGHVKSGESRLITPYRMLKDYALFIKRTRSKTKAIVINLSLGIGGFFRDGLYFLLAPRRAKKIVFFHGWNPEFEKKIDNSGSLKAWLKMTFLRADHILVLSLGFKNKLRQWGYKGPVGLETTFVDESLLRGENFESLYNFNYQFEDAEILYLGKITKAKGVWEVVEAYKMLCNQKGLQNLKCIMAGDGQELEALKTYASTQKLYIEFPGYVRKNQKTAAFKNAHLYIFPSAHEGMPLSVLEAMAFGLPIITTRVGGIPDFFEEGKMGLFLDNRKPAHIAEKIKYLLERPELIKQISEYNYRYAKEHFYASKVAKRFRNIVESVINK